uniref:DUS-like FMN-binding domain-containing protein n=1 Tax=Pyrodinium bahamense TaxID=73915 RepID=A0A7S0FLY9_9DINO
MVVDDTLLHNLEPQKCDRFLGYHHEEHPVVCQLGGSDASKLAQAAQVVERYGYDEVNLNVGCPSCRVAQKGEFGCSLMLRKEVVRDIIHAMSRVVQIPVTVKCRLGVDDQDSPEFTRQFVETVAQGGCRHFIIHARKAWLSGLSPAQNRTIPPLHYPRVLELCRTFPYLSFTLNGGVTDIGHARALLGFPNKELCGETQELVESAWGWHEAGAEGGSFLALPSNLQGIMIGRGAMTNPVMLWDVDHAIYGDAKPSKPLTRRRLLESYSSYLEEVHPEGDSERSVGSVHLATKPTLGLFSGLRGNKAFRVAMDNLMRVKANRELGPAHILAEAMKVVEEANPGLLDDPLPATQAYRPTTGRETSGAAFAGVSSGPPRNAPPSAPRGRKRKNESADAASVEATTARVEVQDHSTDTLTAAGCCK